MRVYDFIFKVEGQQEEFDVEGQQVVMTVFERLKRMVDEGGWTISFLDTVTGKMYYRSFVYRITPVSIYTVVVCDNLDNVKNIGDEIASIYRNETECEVEPISCFEISVVDEWSHWEEARMFHRPPDYSLFDHIKIYMDNKDLQIAEVLLTTNPCYTQYWQAEAKGPFLSKTFQDELNRICSQKNATKYYGNPVHYIIKAVDLNSALHTIYCLCEALRRNGRMASKRVCKISEMRFDEHSDDYIKFFRTLKYNTLIVDTSGKKSDYKPQLLAEQIRKVHNDTLIFIVNVINEPNNAQELVGYLQKDMNFIEITEGGGERKETLVFLKKLISKTNFPMPSDKEIEEILGKGEQFTKAKIFEHYKRWTNEVLIKKLYPSYYKCDAIIKKDKLTIVLGKIKSFIRLFNRV